MSQVRCAGMEVSELIARASSLLTPSERRVAEVVLARPQLVAFGTVAELAEAAGAGSATVVRLAAKLGFEGFSGLQSSVQESLTRQLRPAVERIREPVGSDSVANHLHLELGNVSATLRSLEGASLADTIDHLANLRVRVNVLSGDASLGVARQFVGDLQALRDDVHLLDGNEVAVRRAVALLRDGDVVVALDLRRYDRWVVEGARAAKSAGAWLVAITDSLLSPLGAVSSRTFTVSAAGGGPFDSHVGTLALANLLVAGVADRLRASAMDRLDRAEAAWRAANALTDR